MTDRIFIYDRDQLSRKIKLLYTVSGRIDNRRQISQFIFHLDFVVTGGAAIFDTDSFSNKLIALHTSKICDICDTVPVPCQFAATAKAKSANVK